MGFKIHSFKKSLAKGQKGEEAFLELFPDVLERLDGFMQDFRIKKTGETIEVKTDNYCTTKTENFYMERYSYGDVDGGPWQALSKDSNYFVYWFPKSYEFFCFKTEDLVRELDKITARMPLTNVVNVSHITRGYKVNRFLLEHIAIPIEKVLGIK